MTETSYVDSHTNPGKGRQYDTVYTTDSWHRFLWAREQRILDQLLEDFFSGVPVDLLDFACGTGRIAGALEEKVRSAVGVDVSEPMLEVARSKLRRTTLYHGNL